MHPSFYINVAVIIISVILLLFVLANNIKNPRNLSFAFLLFWTIVWMATVTLTDNASDLQSALYWAKLTIVGPIFMLPTVFSFSLIYPKGEIKSFLNKFLIVFPLALLLLVPTDLNVINISLETWGTALEVGILYYLYFVFFIFYFGYATFILIKKTVKSTPKVRKQIRYVVIGILLSGFFAVLTNLVLVITDLQEASILGPPSIIFLILFTGYSIFRFQFLDIRVVIGRFTYYFLLGVLVTGAYYIVLLVDSALLENPLDITGLVTAIPFSILFITFYDRFKRFIQTNVESRLINPGFDPNEVIVEFNKRISAVLDVEEIGRILEDTVSRTIRPDLIKVYIKLSDKTKSVVGRVIDKDITLNYDHLIGFWRKVNYSYIYLDQIESEVPRGFMKEFDSLSVIVETMREEEIKLILPLGKGEDFDGALLLGSKEADSPYNSVQIKYLQSLCEIVTLALARSKLYEEVQQFNETLQEKIKLATEEIQSQNTRLSEALRIERDMLDVLGHELRTPLGTIRNALGVLEIKYKAKGMTDKDIENFFHIGGENIKREVQLLETILASAKIDNDKLDMNFEKVDAKDVVSDSFEAYKYDAEKKGLKLMLTLPNTTEVPAFADRVRIQQVMDNLTSNAIKYTPTGEVELRLDDEGKFLRFSVRDTGEGIPEEDISKLGTKFFRANMYLNSQGKIGDRRIIRPGGTGIGLYVVYQIVKFMYGAVDVKSKVGKGSTFSFTVLKYTDELASRTSFILAGKNAVRNYNEETRVPVK